MSDYSGFRPDRFELLPGDAIYTPKMVIIGLILIGPWWYLAWVGLAAWVLTGSFSWQLLAPACVMTIGWTVRGVMKYRERAAVALSWPEPVGRQRRSTLLAVAVFLGLCGGIAGWLLAHVSPVQPLNVSAPAFALAGVGWEILHTVRGIPGR